MVEEWKNLKLREEKIRDKQTSPSGDRRYRKALYEVEASVKRPENVEKR